MVDVVMKVMSCKEKLSTSSSVPITDADTKTGDGDDDDAVVEEIPVYLMQDQRMTTFEFQTMGQQQAEECEVADTDSHPSLCTCSADVSEVNEEFMQTDTARICTNSMEESVCTPVEPPISELASVLETENALESEIPHEYSTAECVHRPQTNISEDVCTFAEETAAPEIPELTPETVEESSEISVCLETAEVREKTVTNSTEQLLETTEEVTNDDIEEVLTAEQLEGCEVPSDIVEAELKEKVTSEANLQNWSLDADEVDDLSEVAYDGTLSPEEILSESVNLENKTQPVCNSSDRMIPNDFDGLTEDTPALEVEDTVTSEIPSDTVLLESKKLESSYTSDQVLTVVDEEDQVKEIAEESDQVQTLVSDISSDTVLLESKRLESSYTSDQELTVVNEEDQVKELAEESDEVQTVVSDISHDTLLLESKRLESSYTSDEVVTVVNEEDQVKEMVDEFEEVTISPCETSSESVVAESAQLNTTNTLQLEATVEEDHTTDIQSEFETTTVNCDEVKNESLELTVMTFSLPHSVSDSVTEVNEHGEYTDVAAVDEEKVAEPEEISSSLVSTSVEPKAKNLTTELTSVIEEDSLGDSVDELRGDSIAGDVVENMAAETSDVRDLPQSCAVVVKDEHLEEEFDDLPDDITATSFVSEATEDADVASDSSASVPLSFTTVSSTEFDSASFSAKIQQQTAEQQLSVGEDTCHETGDVALLAEPVVSDVTVDLETAQTAAEPDVCETFVEEEVTIIEEKITESVVTTVRCEEPVEVQEKVITVGGIHRLCVHGVSCGTSFVLLLFIANLTKLFIFCCLN